MDSPRVSGREAVSPGTLSVDARIRHEGRSSTGWEGTGGLERTRACCHGRSAPNVLPPTICRTVPGAPPPAPTSPLSSTHPLVVTGRDPRLSHGTTRSRRSGRGAHPSFYWTVGEDFPAFGLGLHRGDSTRVRTGVVCPASSGQVRYRPTFRVPRPSPET